MLVLAMANVGMAQAPTVYVTAAVSSAAVGDTFDVDIVAGDVEDLFVGDIRLNWDPTILQLEGPINPCPNENSMEVIYVQKHGQYSSDVPAPFRGWLTIAVGRPIGVKTGLSGNVGLARITFRVVGQGDSWLHFWANDLRVVTAEGLESIDATGTDGDFMGTETPAPCLWIQGKGAGVSFDWKSAKWYDCLTNTFTAKVVNTGEVSAEVMVEFRVEGPIGVDIVPSGTVTVPAGGSATVSVDYHVPLAGSYRVVGNLYWGSLSWETDTQGLGGDGLSRVTGNAFKCK